MPKEIIGENCTEPAIDEFPSDGFTRAERRSGFIAIHFAIAIYLFLLLAIVCDDFFVPSIKKICESKRILKGMILSFPIFFFFVNFLYFLYFLSVDKIDKYLTFLIDEIHFVEMKVSEDVAGATIMAAASSSPELFINVIGTFITEGDLGVGTIVGSAVFNILAVPACCGLFAKQVGLL